MKAYFTALGLACLSACAQAPKVQQSASETYYEECSATRREQCAEVIPEDDLEDAFNEDFGGEM